MECTNLELLGRSFFGSNLGCDGEGRDDGDEREAHDDEVGLGASEGSSERVKEGGKSGCDEESELYATWDVVRGTWSDRGWVQTLFTYVASPQEGCMHGEVPRPTLAC